MSGHDKIGGTFVVGHGGCTSGAPCAPHGAWTSFMREMFGGSAIVGLSLGWWGCVAEVQQAMAIAVEDTIVWREVGYL